MHAAVVLQLNRPLIAKFGIREKKRRQASGDLQGRGEK